MTDLSSLGSWLRQPAARRYGTQNENEPLPLNRQPSDP